MCRSGSGSVATVCRGAGIDARVVALSVGFAGGVDATGSGVVAGFALACSVMPRFALLCFGLLWFALLCFRLLCCALVCSGFALLCSGLV